MSDEVIPLNGGYVRTKDIIYKQDRVYWEMRVNGYYGGDIIRCSIIHEYNRPELGDSSIHQKILWEKTHDLTTPKAMVKAMREFAIQIKLFEAKRVKK